LNLQWSLLPEAFAIFLLVLGSTVFWVWVLVKCALEDLPEKTKIAWIIVIASTHWFGAGLYLCWRKLVRKEKPARLSR